MPASVVSAKPFERWHEATGLGEQVGGFFPAPSAAFDHCWSGALEDSTGASLQDGEPSVVGTP
jgi:hypothetical protein